MGKRLVKAGFENTAEMRRQYRSLFYGATLSGAISGAILHPEGLEMHLDDGRSFVEALRSQGILVGVKVDEGLEPLQDGFEGETATKGLEGLGARLDRYKAMGASFAKWRAAIRIVKNVDSATGENVYEVSALARETNALQLAAYARICQQHGVMPIVEPEILIDGDHDEAVFGRVTKDVLAECMRELLLAGVDIEGILLKPQMIVRGVDGAPGERGSDASSPTGIAKRTLRVLRQTVPPGVKGIMFLSGGQTEYQSTVNLNTLNVVARAYPEAYGVPYALSFSFGRGLQASVLEMWRQGASREACMRKAEEIARVNGLAARGAFFEETGAHPTICPRDGNLQETFRGVY